MAKVQEPGDLEHIWCSKVFHEGNGMSLYDLVTLPRYSAMAKNSNVPSLPRGLDRWYQPSRVGINGKHTLFR